MDGGIGDLLNVFMSNPEMMKKASDLLSRLSPDAPNEGVNNVPVSAPDDRQAAVPVMAQAETPQTESNPSAQGLLGNMSGDQLATMVSTVMSALGMNSGAQNPAPADVPPPAEPSPVQENTDSPADNDGAAAIPAANFDIERALGVLKNVSSETSPKKDNRIQLLLSLKPFMKDGRKQKIDMAVKYLNAAKVFNMFGKNGFI